MVALRCAGRVLSLITLVVGFTPSGAWAWERDDDLTLHRLDRYDEDVADVEVNAPPEGSLWLTLQGKAAFSPGGRDLGAMVLLGMPLERVVVARSTTGDRAARAEPPPGEEPAEVEPEPLPEEVPVTVLVTPRDARAAVRAALAAARSGRAAARLDDLQSRANSSALLPEVRLRVTRLIDEDQRLAPTEYDPDRTTASGGSSLWLEGRLMWRLDRLVFASEEVALERLRVGHERERERLSLLVVKLLATWQRARTLELDDMGEPEDRRAAALDAMEAELALEVLTDGWFSRWQGSAEPEESASR